MPGLSLEWSTNPPDISAYLLSGGLQAIHVQDRYGASKRKQGPRTCIVIARRPFHPTPMLARL